MTRQGLSLARVAPSRREMAATPGAPAAPVPSATPGRALSPQEKAAVIVRFLMAQGMPLPLTRLPEAIQASLAEGMAALRLVDRATLDQVVAEFTGRIESVGLAFPGGLEGVIAAMDGHISPAASSRLRRKAGAAAGFDPWERLAALPPDLLRPVLEAEAVEVAAVILSKLPVPQAAELLNLLPGERARRIAFAVSQTGNVDPATVRRIGNAVLTQIDSAPPRAFDRDPVERVGAILDITAAATRDAVLKGLEAEDRGFAEQVRKVIFTFAHVPARLAARDVPKAIRLVTQTALVRALSWARGREGLEQAAEFLLANMSPRMAQTLREEVAETAPPREREAEAAMGEIVAAIRQLHAAGELALIEPEEEAPA